MTTLTEASRATTVVAEQTVPPADAGASPPGDGPAASPAASTAREVIARASGALCLLLVLVLGFAGHLYGLSSLSEHRAQATTLANFSYALDQAVAPVGPTKEGKPVAVLDIPAIGLHGVVVVEGTSSRDLMNGPGHRPDTVLPGQAGVSVLYGKRATYGAPFGHLMGLRVGDIITATTGQGVAKYRVSSFGDGHNPAPANSTNRIVLTTADSSGRPRSTVSVSADLVTDPQPSPGGLQALQPEEKGLAGDAGGSLVPLLLWSQALLALAVLATLCARRLPRWPVYLLAAPTLLAVLWNLYENAAGILPNMY